LPTSTSATHTIPYPTTLLSDCADTPTVTVWYKDVGGNDWNSMPSVPTDGNNLASDYLPMTNYTTGLDDGSTTDTDIVFTFDSAVWSWGDSEIVTQEFKIEFQQASYSS
jgi:hypothetical protein